jgi:hypothetical protein
MSGPVKGALSALRARAGRLAGAVWNTGTRPRREATPGDSGKPWPTRRLLLRDSDTTVCIHSVA